MKPLAKEQREELLKIPGVTDTLIEEWQSLIHERLDRDRSQPLTGDQIRQDDRLKEIADIIRRDPPTGTRAPTSQP
jgi:hypothetical protein